MLTIPSFYNCRHTDSDVTAIFQNTEPEIPEYEELNIRLRGYDFSVLESFMKYVHNIADVLDISADA